MALAHVVALLRKLLRNWFRAMAEARELRRRMARRHPHIEQ
jgi:hypothetical protein